MVVSGLLIKIPYWVCWQVLRIFGRLQGVVFYVESEHDYQIIEYILPHINKPYRIVARNRHVAEMLQQRGVEARIWPAFPTLLIMTRHAFHRFPINNMKKIGLMHGPFYFKRMIKPERYNAFDLYLFTSQHVVDQAAVHGVGCGVVGGYARIDAFKDSRVIVCSQQLKSESVFSDHKKILLFSATWDGSGQSAIDRWVDDLSELSVRYNILVSIHPLMSKSYKEKVEKNKHIRVVGQHELYAAMMIADVLVCDTSSIMAEFCVLDKPVITFKVDKGHRLTPEIQSMISDISVQIEKTDELDEAIERYLKQPDLKQENRKRWTSIMFDDLLISHGVKAAAVINTYIDNNDG